MQVNPGDNISLIQEHVSPFLKNVCNIEISNVEEMKSAQQKVYQLCCSTNHIRTEDDTQNDVEKESMFRQALHRGAGKLIVRQWVSPARFWNLNNKNFEDIDAEIALMANAEVMGYRIARKILQARAEILPENHQIEMIPELLYFSGYEEKTSIYWAILSYAGRGSLNFGLSRIYDDKFVLSMVKVRREYGFDEPHPRHGRVTEENSQFYAMKVIEQIVLPIHEFFFKRRCPDRISLEDLSLLNPDGAVEYLDMVNTYDRALKKLIKHIMCDENNTNWTKLLVVVLEQSILFLFEQAKQLKKIPSVLVHCDLQPQNLMFYRTARTSEKNIPDIACVLDWEEANFADPRFELLLICRKVCANMNQAHSVWEYYSTHIYDHFNVAIGSIKPWMQLEGVHSVIQLLLQNCNLVGGGRNPWESKPDLVGKIDRELFRLSLLGMDFCSKALIDQK